MLVPSNRSGCQRKNPVEIIQQKVAREVEHLLRLLMRTGEPTAPLDLEAVEMAIRGSMHQEGAAVLHPLLEFPPPARDCRHGQTRVKIR